MKIKTWKDIAMHRVGCPYKGVDIRSTEVEMVKYHSGYCPGCIVPVKREEVKNEKKNAAKQ